MKSSSLFFFNDTATTEIYTLSLHDALPIWLAMQDAAHALTKQFLAWVAEAPRSYADADAWRRSCPHLSVWEDAIANGLIQFKNGSTMKESQILLTGRGRSFLKMN